MIKDNSPDKINKISQTEVINQLKSELIESSRLSKSLTLYFNDSRGLGYSEKAKAKVFLSMDIIYVMTFENNLCDKEKRPK